MVAKSGWQNENYWLAAGFAKGVSSLIYLRLRAYDPLAAHRKL